MHPLPPSLMAGQPSLRICVGIAQPALGGVISQRLGPLLAHNDYPDDAMVSLRMQAVSVSSFTGLW